MLRFLSILLLAPFGVLTHPISSSAGQLVFQFPASPVIDNGAAPSPSSAVQLVYQFQDLVKIENTAARSNGHLVLTVVNEPLVYDIDPKARRPSPKLLHKFSGVTSLTGIAETAPDIFAVVVGNWSSATFAAVPGSFSIWSVDLNTPEPTVKIITSIPGAAALNGATPLDGSPDIILIADSTLGAVWRVNVVTGDHSIAIQDPLFTTCTTASPIGINGLDIFGGKLYFLNSAQVSYGRVPISDDGSAAGEVEILARVEVPSARYDDFDMDWEGNAWVATHPNALTEVTIEGKQRNITGDGNIMEMTQPTSATFGRGSKQREKTLYVTTSGSSTAGGQVIAIDTCLI